MRRQHTSTCNHLYLAQNDPVRAQNLLLELLLRGCSLGVSLDRLMGTHGEDHRRDRRGLSGDRWRTILGALQSEFGRTELHCT